MKKKPNEWLINDIFIYTKEEEKTRERGGDVTDVI